MQPTEKQKLDALIAERDQFLEKNPHLKEMQEKIDSILDSCSSQSDRLQAINMMMSESASKMSEEWTKLGGVLENVKSNLKKEME